MNARLFEFTALARLDLIDIWNHLADESSIDVADRILGDVEKACNELARSPDIGHPRHDLTKRKVLFYLVHSYLVVYRPDSSPLHILRVLHSARNVKNALRKRS